jgi:hypothetical protein
MSIETDFDYGPLQGLIGQWRGDKGIDISPEPDDIERSPFYETITFNAAGDVDNADKQNLTILAYHQHVYRKSNDGQFHDQVGYFTWDAAMGIITHSFVIPRGVAIVAGGKVTEQSDEEMQIQLGASDGDADWGISQSPFMRDNARTVSFSQHLILNEDTLSYEQTMVLDIYGRIFNHIDKSKLERVS